MQVIEPKSYFRAAQDARARAKFVLHDRDASFTQAFDAVFQAAGIRVIRSAIRGCRTALSPGMVKGSGGVWGGSGSS